MSEPRFSYSLAQLQEMSETVLRLAKEAGASAAEAEVSLGFGQNVSVRMNETETIEYNRDKGVSVSVYFGQQKATQALRTFPLRRFKILLPPLVILPAIPPRMNFAVWQMPL